jgi:hypothetical protein
MPGINTDIEKLEQVITEILTHEFEAQGHKMTGKIMQDIEYVVKQETNKLTISGMIYPYGNILASGTKAARIPFSGRTGRGGTSLYIQALQRYVQQRMNINDEKKSLSIAFAIAHTQKKEGMPTSGSYKFSSTGQRTDWIGEAFRAGEDKIKEAISDMVFSLLTVQIDVLISKWNLTLNK